MEFPLQLGSREVAPEPSSPALLTEARLPLLAGFQNAVTAGIPLVQFSPDHIGAHAIRDIARTLVAPAVELAPAVEREAA